MIHTKNKRDQVSQKRKPRRSTLNKPIDNCLAEISFNKWESQLPRWLTEARTAIVSGNREDVAEILNPERIEQVLKGQPGQLKIVVIYNIVKLLREIGQIKRAESLCAKLVKLQPDNYIVYNEMGILSRRLGNISGAVKYFTKSKEINPDDPKIWADLGCNTVGLGQTESGIELIRRAVEKMPENNYLHSNLLFLLHYLPELDRQEIFNEHKKWAQIHAPSSHAKTDHDNDPDPDRKLRIGYISPDFHRHVVAPRMELLLDEHDRDAVEVYGYGSVERPDEVTTNLRNKFDHYRDIWKVGDQEVAGIIEQDKIDILVDLTGHCNNNRLLVLAYKPAPVQVTYFGYSDTTGMQAIDYLLTDSLLTPPQSQKFHTEQLICLPGGVVCYTPQAKSPDVTSPPVVQKGYITFGAFTSIYRFNNRLLGVWAEILKSTPNSRLLLGFRGGDDAQLQHRFLSQLEECGLSPERIEICGTKPYFTYLEQYNEVDIVLDTFPENGGITTCDALWMGVPVISLVGDHRVERAGLGMLSKIGMEFFVASTLDEYVSKAVALAAKPDALVKIRGSMRNRMMASPLCDKDMFIKNIEQAHRNIWKKWCKSKIAKLQSKDVNKEQHVFLGDR